MQGTGATKGKRWAAAVACLLAIAGAACSGGEEPPADETPTSADGHDHSHDFGENVDNFKFALGNPGKAADATRTIEVETKSDFKFVPEGLDVKAGQTVTFNVTNTDKIDHEFVLGNKEYQELHESQVKAGGVFHDYSDYSVHVQPGETMSVTWTFERSGRVLFACHIEGHYDAGMIGEIAVS